MCDSNKNDNYLCINKHNSSYKFSLTKVENLQSFICEDNVIAEFPLCLFVNNKYEHTFLCSPFQLKELVFGYLCSKNLISYKDDILSFKLSENLKVAYVEINKFNSPQRKSILYLNEYDFIEADPVENNNIEITASDISNIMNLNLNISQLFKDTAGAHCISIYGNGKLIIACEDVARHNAMDKAIGYCLLNNIPLNNKIIFASGRLSFEMIKKAARVQIPIIIGKSATTSLVIETAQRLNITLVGFVRDKKMNIYTNPHRIVIK